MEIADVFSSKAKFKVLRLLNNYSQPVPLRTIATLVNTPIRSIVLAMDSLSKQKIVRDLRRHNTRLYWMNQTHPFYDELKNIFAQIEMSDIKLRSRANQKEADKAFKFIQDSNQLFLSLNKS